MDRESVISALMRHGLWLHSLAWECGWVSVPDSFKVSTEIKTGSSSKASSLRVEQLQSVFFVCTHLEEKKKLLEQSQSQAFDLM